MTKTIDPFTVAVERVLEHEGYDRYTDDPDDPGGATKWGISLRFLQSVDEDLNHDGAIDSHDIRNLTKSQAVEFYRNNWWIKYRYGLLENDALGAKVFNISVNTGPGIAHKCLQRALRSCQLAVVEDGILGPKSRAACNSLVNDGGLLPSFCSEVAGYYRVLVALHPRMERFINGWLNRAYG